MRTKTVVFFSVLLVSYLLLIKWIRPYYLTSHYLNSDKYVGHVEAWEHLEISNSSLVFIGNSLVRGFETESFRIPTVKMALGGDVLAGLQFRLSKICESKPKFLVINMGVNDIINGFGFSLDKLDKFVEEVATCSSNTQLFLMSLGPQNLEPGFFTRPSRIQNELEMANSEIKALCHEKRLTYVDVYSLLSLNGKLKNEYSKDGLHLNSKGYRVWYEALCKAMNLRP